MKQARDYCKKRGWELVQEYVEAGASARDDKRPEFRKLIGDACIDPSPYDIVLVHSLSRFYRDAIDQGFYRRKLEKHAVLLHSITQDFGEGAQAELIQTVIAACDAHTSAETAKHTARSMKENALQGSWNGERPPLGYRTYVAEIRGDKKKKKLEIDPERAELVKLIFKLYMQGDRYSGPMGIKQIASYLNERSIKTDTGSEFYTSYVYATLTRQAYTGTHYYNQYDSRARKPRPREEWIPIKVPEIIPLDLFNRVQQLLGSRNPQVTPPRIVNSPVLLSGLARCGNCGSKLMLTTGKSGMYRYYSCASKVLKGSNSCDHPIHLPEARLDTLVAGALVEQLFRPTRLRELLSDAVRQARVNSQGTMNDLSLLRRELRDTDRKVGRLFDALTSGAAADTKGFRDHQIKLERHRDELTRLIAARKQELALPASRLTNRQVKRFGDSLSELFQSGPATFRKQYLRLFVECITVTEEEIRISGTKPALANAIQQQKGAAPDVLSFVRKWPALQDSNLGPTA